MLDNFSNVKLVVLVWIEILVGWVFVFCEGDVCDGVLLCWLFKVYGIEIVMYFVGFKVVGELVYKLLEYFDNNV